jgi:pilus assembly protein CpaE
MRKLKLLALLTSTAVEAELKAAAEGLDVELECHNGRQVPPGGTVPDILLVEVGPSRAEERNELSVLLSDRAARTQVIAIGADAAVEDIRLLMRLGASDYLPRPIDAEEFAEALETASGKLAGADTEVDTAGRVLTFLRASGGAGATTLAVETAAQIAASHKGAERPSVCLLDFDFQFGNVALSLDITTEAGLGPVIEAGARVDDEFLRGAFSHHESGVDVLAAPAQLLPLDTMTPERASRILDFARYAYDFTVIDMPHAWTDWTQDVLAFSDLAVLVTTLDVPAIARVRRQMEAIAGTTVNDVPMALVLNGDRGWSGRARRREAEKSLGRPFDAVIGHDPETAAAARDRGVLVSQVRSRSPIAKGIRQFVRDTLASRTESSRPTTSPILNLSPGV